MAQGSWEYAVNALVMVPNKDWSLVIPPEEPEDHRASPFTYYAIVLDPQDGWVNTVGTQFSVADVAVRIAVGWRVATVNY